MELNQKIAWWEGSELKLFHAKGDSIVESGIGNTGYATLVLPGEIFSRRFHPRPFMNRDKLKKILPTFLLDNLFNEKGGSKSIATMGVLKTPSFSSFSVSEDMLNDFVNKTGIKISPVVETVPLPLGLAFYAPKGETSIVIAPTVTGVIASLVGDTGEVKDFRCLNKEKWQKEAGLTICGWNTSKNIKVYSIGSVFIPSNFNFISVKMPQNMLAEMAALNGIAQLYNGKIVKNTISTSDTTTQQNKYKFFRSLLLPLTTASVFTLFVLGNLWFSSYSMDSKVSEMEAETSALFAEVLPNVPLVDAVAQISRRLSEVSYASGEKIMASAPLTEQISNLQKQLDSENLPVKVSEISLSNDGFRFRGLLTNLSDVDKVKKALSVATGKTVTLHNAQMIQGTGVDFYMEAK